MGSKQTSKHFLEIHIQLTNGQKLNYYESVKENAIQLIKQIKPQKIFTENYLTIANDISMTGITPSAISYIVFKTPASIQWPFPAHLENTELIDKNTFSRAIRTELNDAIEKMNSNQGGIPIDHYWQVVMRDGTHFYFRVHAKTLIRMEKIQVPKLLGDLSAFHALGPAGAVIINMANISSWTVFPGPTEFAPSIWQLSQLSD